MKHDPLDELAAVHALDALTGVELARFETHLAQCGQCRREVDDLRETASLLVGDELASSPAWQRITTHLGLENGSIVEIAEARLRTRSVWIGAVAAATAILFAAAIAMLASEPGTPESVVASAESAATDPGAIDVEFLVGDEAVARLILSENGQGFLIPTDALDPLPTDRAYQLWVINDNAEVISAGVFGPDPQPSTFTWNGEVTGFALTREIAGGVSVSAGDVVSAVGDV